MTGGTWAAAASRAWRVGVWLMYELLLGALTASGATSPSRSGYTRGSKSTLRTTVNNTAVTRPTATPSPTRGRGLIREPTEGAVLCTRRIRGIRSQDQPRLVYALR